MTNVQVVCWAIGPSCSCIVALENTYRTCPMGISGQNRSASLDDCRKSWLKCGLGVRVGFPWRGSFIIIPFTGLRVPDSTLTGYRDTAGLFLIAAFKNIHLQRILDAERSPFWHLLINLIQEYTVYLSTILPIHCPCQILMYLSSHLWHLYLANLVLQAKPLWTVNVILAWWSHRHGGLYTLSYMYMCSGVYKYVICVQTKVWNECKSHKCASLKIEVPESSPAPRVTCSQNSTTSSEVMRHCEKNVMTLTLGTESTSHYQARLHKHLPPSEKLWLLCDYDHMKCQK